MKAFPLGKVIWRRVTIRSSDKGLPEKEWDLGFGFDGLVIRETGRGGRRWRLSWKSIIGTALVHGMDVPKKGAP